MDLGKYRKDIVLEMQEERGEVTQRPVEKAHPEIWKTPTEPEPHDELYSTFLDAKQGEEALWGIAVKTSSKSKQAGRETKSLSVSHSSSSKLLKDRNQTVQKTSITVKTDLCENIAAASQSQRKISCGTIGGYECVKKEPFSKPYVKTRLDMTNVKNIVSHPAATSSKLTMSSNRLPRSSKMTTVVIQEEFIGMPLGGQKLDLSKGKNPLNNTGLSGNMHSTVDFTKQTKPTLNLIGQESEGNKKSRADYKPKSFKSNIEGRFDVRADRKDDRVRDNQSCQVVPIVQESAEGDRKSRADYKPKSSRSKKDERLSVRGERKDDRMKNNQSCQVAIKQLARDLNEVVFDVESGHLTPQEMNEQLKRKRWNLVMFFLKKAFFKLLDIVWMTLCTAFCFALAYHFNLIPRDFVDSVGVQFCLYMVVSVVIMMMFSACFFKYEILKLRD